jgi:hypothetical protein
VKFWVGLRVAHLVKLANSFIFRALFNRVAKPLGLGWPIWAYAVDRSYEVEST